jgi:hypothetical protein
MSVTLLRHEDRKNHHTCKTRWTINNTRFSETFEKRDSEAFGVNVWRAVRAAPRLY